MSRVRFPSLAPPRTTTASQFPCPLPAHGDPDPPDWKMKKSRKPVRKCHACPLNLGEHCWVYLYPRGQWRDGRHCPGFSDAGLHASFEDWSKEPSVKTRKELRREFFRTRRRTELRRELAAGEATAARRERRRQAGGSGGRRS